MAGYQLTGVDLSATHSTPAFVVGSHYEDVDGKVYKYVQYITGAGSVAAASGNVAYYDAESGYTNHKVTSDLSDSDEIGAGVLQGAPADQEYCWIQIKGLATLNTSLTAGSDGDPLTPTGASDGTLDVTTAATDHRCAIAEDASNDEVICDFPM